MAIINLTSPCLSKIEDGKGSGIQGWSVWRGRNKDLLSIKYAKKLQ